MRWRHQYLTDLTSETCLAWDHFWFRTRAPETLALARILAGLLLCYTHLVWLVDLSAFLGPHAWVDASAWQALGGTPWRWSHLWWVDHSPGLLLAAHVIALVPFVGLTLGWHTRICAVLAFALTVSYGNRAAFALYGLDQVNAFLSLYLAVGDSGAIWSLDANRRVRGGVAHVPPMSVSTNIATRLLQLHLCVIYLTAGLAKLQGESWWNGTALWYAIANREYQTLPLNGLCHWPLLINLLTHAALAWEVSYVALVWPRRTRPLVLAMAVPLHLGIALGLGMMTFGLAMLIANLAFVSPTFVRARAASMTRRRSNDAPPPGQQSERLSAAA